MDNNTSAKKKASTDSFNSDSAMLCIPLGGLNDTLCQIQTCLKACMQSKPPRQKLYIADYCSEGTCGLFLDFFYFKDSSLSNHKIINLSEQTEFNFSPLMSYKTTYPRRFHQNFPEILKETTKIAQGKSPLLNLAESINFRSGEIHEELVIHISHGGGQVEPNFLKMLMPTKLSADLLRNSLNKMQTIPENFAGIHARNTDNKIKSDWKALISHVNETNTSHMVFICSDDRELIDFALSLPDHKFFTVGEDIPYLKGHKSLHALNLSRSVKSQAEGHKAFTKQLLDLIFLSKCERIYSLPSHPWGDGYSGFLKLALALKKSGSDWLNSIQNK